jgi:hypothetical protein
VDREIFGLGRDFVKALDRFRRGPARKETSKPSENWDVNPLVLRAENVLNAAFRNFGGGVGIGMTLRP